MLIIVGIGAFFYSSSSLMISIFGIYYYVIITGSDFFTGDGAGFLTCLATTGSFFELADLARLKVAELLAPSLATERVFRSVYYFSYVSLMLLAF